MTPLEPNDPSTPTGAAHAALDWVEAGMTVGLGTGRAAAAFVDALGERVRDGLAVTGVPTSQATAARARKHGIALTSLAAAGRLDVTFDGADEVDPDLDLIKGYGAAMVREKIVAACSTRLVILVGPEKLVDRLGDHGRLPIEVLPFGEALVTRELERLGLVARLRDHDTGNHEQERDTEPLVTDNGNWVLDAKLTPPFDARRLESEILAIPGVVGTGFFLGMTDAVLIGAGENVEIRRARV